MKKLILTFLFALLMLPLFSLVHAQGAIPGISENAEALDACEEGNWSANCTAPLVKSAEITWMNCVLGYTPACTKNKDKAGLFFQNSVLGTTTHAMATLYKNKPADTMQFFAYYGEKLSIAKPAHAQGIGFAGLSPLLPLWRASRNVAYGFTIVIMIGAGFMIIFRVKIDPRTVISIQMAIPRVILTLILITFSYAIVGLMIDLMYLLIFLVVSILNSVVGFPDFQRVLTNYTGGNLGTLFGSVWTAGESAIDDLSTMLGGNVGSGITALLTAIGLGVATGSLVTFGAVGALAGASALAGNNPVVALLIMLALAFTFIRILVTLISAYINIIVAVIFGPIQIMFDAIPNSNSFGNWMRGLIANLSVFVIVPTMLLLATVLSDRATASPGLWSPPGLSGFNFGGGLAGIIGIGFVFVIPQVANSIKELLKVKPVIPTGAGAVLSPISSVWSTAMGGASQVYYLSQLKSMLPGVLQGKHK